MKRTLFKISVMFLLCICFGSTLSAQKVVSGIVTDQEGEPLIGVSISLAGSNTGTITDVDGSYSLTVPDDSGTLEYSYLGYRTQTINVSDANANMNVMLDMDNAILEEVVITGLATSVKRANLANAVARIDATELTGVAPQSTVDQALYGKFAGAEIRANSGAPGGGLSFKLRGTTSISGSSQPLIILDGVFIDNSSIPAGLNAVSRASSGGSTSNQDNPSNRLADIDPADIESIEILKGASTAAIYGSRASGGVVIIKTKRGSNDGEPVITVSQSIGQTSMLNPLGVREFTEEKVLNSAYASNIEDFRAAESSGSLQNYEDLLFGNKGLLSNTRLSVTGGNDKTKFYFGGSYKDEEGIVENTGYDKASFRMNLDQKVSNRISAELSTNYIWSSADRGFFNNDNSGTTMGIALTSTPSFAQLLPDANGIYPANPYAPSNFLETAATITNNEKVNRFIGGTTITTKLLQQDSRYVNFILRGGVDFYNFASNAIFPNTLQFYRGGVGLNGVIVQGNTNNLNNNLAAFLVYSESLSSGLNLRTSAGLTGENFNRNTIVADANNIIGTQTNLDQSGGRNVNQFRILQKDRGFFVQEEINWQDKVIATLGFRGDKSSNNSEVNKLFFYPKANLAINLNRFGGLASNDNISVLKLRAAYGESGNFAAFGSKSTILNSGIVDGTAGVFVPALNGNSSVGPERQRELEFGFDVGLGSRLLFDFTHYIKSVDDLLLNASLPTSSGFVSQVTNAAALENRGFEIGANVNVVNTQNLQWNARVNWWKNQAEVTRLDVPAFTTGGFADFLGNFMIKEGFSPTTIIGVGENPTVTLNGDGEPTLQIYGNAEPDFQMSWSNQMSYRNFDFSMLWHWKKGGENINLSALLFDLGETTWDYDDTDLDPSGELTNGPYRVSQLGVNTGPYIEDSSYLRMREIGVYYNLPMLFAKANWRIGFSGNNLINFFDYRSYDPEVSNFGGNGLSTGVEVNPFPSAKRFDFHVRATF